MQSAARPLPPMRDVMLSAFATPVVNFRWPDTQDLNAALAKLIGEREAADDGVVKSNVGGWHSGLDFLAWDAACIRELVGRLRTFAAELNRAVLQPERERDAERFVLEGWANVLRDGQYNTLHNHPNAFWSGVYYVTDNPPAAGRPFSGRLELVDPRPGASLTFAEHTTLYGRFMVNPVAGQMIMFPAWLHHFVHPTFGPEPRISIAFNVIFQ